MLFFFFERRETDRQRYRREKIVVGVHVYLSVRCGALNVCTLLKRICDELDSSISFLSNSLSLVIYTRFKVNYLWGKLRHISRNQIT